MSDIKISAETRSEFGKGAARRLRRQDKVPAVLYGHGEDPVHLALPAHDTMMAMKIPNALITLNIEGKPQLSLPKHVQRDPIKHTIKHVDLLIVKRGEKVVVDVPVHIVGDAAANTVVSLDRPMLSVLAEATHLPEYIEVSVEGLEAGTQLHASDLELPKGTELDADADVLVVNVTEETEIQEPEETEAEGEGEAAEAEGEEAESDSEES